MRRYFMQLAYDGTNFSGWQRQLSQRTVQGVIEENLSKILRGDIQITGCGRTDTGVHAADYYAHFNCDTEVDVDTTRYKLNKMLRDQVVIHDLFEASDRIHARFSATQRAYRYFILTKRDPFKRKYAWYIPYELNVDLMNEAAATLLEYNDFESFARSGSDVNHFNCDVRKAVFTRHRDEIHFDIAADRFLRNMVRAIVGTLIDVGLGKLSVADFRSIVEQKDRTKAGTSAKGHGLFLWDIQYNELLESFRK